MTEAKRNEMKRSETEIPEALMTAMTTVTPAGDAAGGGRCKRPRCAAPLPAQESGRARQFCGLRGSAAAVPPPPADRAGPALAPPGHPPPPAPRPPPEAAPAMETARDQHARALPATQAAGQDRAGAARALADAAIARAERAEAALDAERAERRALTDRLTAAAPGRTRARAAAGSGT